MSDPSEKAPSTRSNLKVLSISLGVSLLFAELLLRLVAAPQSDEKYTHRIPHERYGWVLEPGARYDNAMPEETVSVTYNTSGFRDHEHTKDKAEGALRAVLLGDSFMEAYSVSLEAAMGPQMQTLAKSAGTVLEVINLGVGGYGTLQETLLFEDIGRTYAPDIVLLAFYVANDVRNNSAELETLSNAGGSDSLKVQSRPFLDPNQPETWAISQVDFEGAKRRYAEAKAEEGTLWATMMRHSVLLQLSTGLIQKMTQAGVSKAERFLGRHGISYCKEPKAYTSAWKTTERILQRLKQKTDAVGGKLLVFSVPALEELDPSFRESVEARAPEDVDLCLDKAPGHARLQGITQAVGIEFLSLLAPFQKAHTHDTPLYRASDRHWNAQGHALAAQHVMNRLKKKGWLSQGEKGEKDKGAP